MPILWRHLSTQFLKTFTLCLCTCIFMLLMLRLEDIAHFASLGAEGVLVLWYILYQIPYIIPITIPLSCMIAALMLMQHLSSTHELTAFRSAGLSFTQIISPILMLSALCSILNFYFISEIATRSHMASGLLKTELRSINPLFILNNKHFMKSKGYHFHSFGNSVVGESTSQSILALTNKKNPRMNLIVADHLNIQDPHFSAEKMTLITSVKKDDNQKERLIIENLAKTTTSIEDFKKMIDKRVGHLNNDHLSLPLLLMRLQEELHSLKTARGDIDRISKNVNKCISEVFKRLSVGLSPFTLAFMGSIFGISLSRQRSNKGIYIVFFFAALYLICFFSAKGAEHHLYTSSAFYFLPHFLIIGVSVWALLRLTKGKCFT